MYGKLYLAATPIGNLGDLTPRCGEILKSVDFIAAEDTRVTIKLLNHLNIKKELISYYEHNKEKSGAKILSRLMDGQSCALVTDAGMPAISDPGQALVQLCAENGIEVIGLPGPCAAVTALAVSGLPTGRFTFEGFLSTAKKSRDSHLKELILERRTMIFYEAPHKLKRTLRDMLDAWGDREITLSREMTKKYEETIRTTLSGAIKLYETQPPRGEYVLIIRGAEEPVQSEYTLEQAVNMVQDLRYDGMSLKQAALQISGQTGFSKNKLYGLAVSDREESE